ncbi:MAG: L-threonylcarbamoyladenylate synthase [Sulfurimonas sp.]|nr:L-threonylcarbamoyladenylate synthase [Sulfurimonas sp.]
MNTLSELSQSIKQASTLLKKGKIVAFPTETVYGLGADASNTEAVKSIFTLKGRPTNHPLIVHIFDESKLNEWAKDIPESAWKLAKAFWPGPLTLILPRLSNVNDVVTGGLDTVALRVPDHPVALALLGTFGGGIVAPSANLYGRVSPTSAEDVREEFASGVDLVLDGGRCSIGIESTIVDLSTSTPRILRPGKITEKEIYSVLGSSLSTISDSSIACPGNKSSHYAPQAHVILSSLDDVEKDLQEALIHTKKVALLAANLPNQLAKNVIYLPLGEDVATQAHNLYHSLRKADHMGLEVLVVVMPLDDGIGHAVCDRLRRAAGLKNWSQVN